MLFHNSTVLAYSNIHIWQSFSELEKLQILVILKIFLFKNSYDRKQIQFQINKNLI